MASLRHFSRRRSVRSLRQRQLFLELLEDRRVLSVFMVNSTEDEPDRSPGDGQAMTIHNTTTLRAAVMEANASPGIDTIMFKFEGGGPHIIQPVEALPKLTEPIIIDGYQGNAEATPNTNSFEQGSNATLNIVLDGTLTPAGSNGLTIEGGNSIVRGLVIQRFTWNAGPGTGGFGIVLGIKGGNLVEGNFIGTDVEGAVAMPNTSGIAVASDNNTIGGITPAARNVISGNHFNGIQIGSTRDGDSTGGAGNRIQGNYIGTNAAGNRPLPNDNGIRLTKLAGWNTLGGTTSGAGNVLSGNRFQGILMDVEGSGHNVVQGNFIGTDPTGNVTDPDGTPGSGDELGNGDDGVDISGVPNNSIGGSTPEAGNVISGNRGAGVLISLGSATGNVVTNNRIGTNAAGTWLSIHAHMGNGGDGVQLQHAPENRVEDNLISNNEQYGIGIVGERATNNQVQGNLIGTDVTGTVAMGNEIGVSIVDAPSNFVGGLWRNVISGNDSHGVSVSGVGASGNFIQGNYIGTDVTGLGRLGNQFDGVRIVHAPRNTIGGAGDAKRNLISGNDRHGVHISGAEATGNVVLSNTIGLDLTGGNTLANRGCGVVIDGAPFNRVGQQAGTGTDRLGNVLSGNGEHGILIQGQGASEVVSNFIGTDQTGRVAHANTGDGIRLLNTVNNVIGGDRAAAGNLISGNSRAGVSIEGGAENRLVGNLIGTDNSVPAQALPNTTGVKVTNSSSNRIGAVTAGVELSNVISGNREDGIRIEGRGAVRNIVDGNYVGTDQTGMAAVPNGKDGIAISGASQNEIGVVSAAGVGSNVIAGNVGYGVSIVGADLNEIRNNLIGIGASGLAVPNLAGGILLRRTTGNFVGSSTPGSGNVISGNATGPGIHIVDGSLDHIRCNNIGMDHSGRQPRPNLVGIQIDRSQQIRVGVGNTTDEQNVISGNTTDGIVINESYGILVSGNIIGLNVDAETALPNLGNGVVIQKGSGNLIGSDASGYPKFGNVISGNAGNGILIRDSLQNDVRNNFIGTNRSGDSERGNLGYGIRLEYASQNVIGGARYPDGNLIAGHAILAGLSIYGGNSNIVQGNYIGTDKSGVEAIANVVGIEVDESDSNWLGLTTSFPHPDRANVISGNSGTGVILQGSTTSKNRVIGNRIGVQADAVSPLGNAGDGILIRKGANDNWVGWTGSAEANTIAFHGGSGIVVEDGTRNMLRGNSIHDNVRLGIDLGADGVTLNDVLDSDSGPNRLQNYPSLKSVTNNNFGVTLRGSLHARPATSYIIDFYHGSCDTSGYGEGSKYFHTALVTTDSRGDVAFATTVPNLYLAATSVTATATEVDNTSEFSACVPVLTDNDDDGASDEVEDRGPHGGDGNQDGVPDSQQPHVATIENPTTGDFVTFVADAGSALRDVQAAPHPAPASAPPGIRFDLGFFSYRIQLPPGQNSTSVTLIPASPVAVNTYYKYGPTPDDSNPHWYEFLFDGTTGAEFVAGAEPKVVLHFVDGARGDHDLTVNGEIVDPGGPAAPIAPGLRITGDAAPLPAFAGQQLAYRLTVSNHSPETAHSVLFTDALPHGVHWVSANTSSGAALTQSAGTVTGNLGPLPSGQSVEVTITVLLTAAGDIRNTATVSGSVTDLDLTDNTVTVGTQVSPPPMTIPREFDLAVVQTATPQPVGVGGDLTYSLTVTNNGPDPAKGIVLSDILPADVQLVSVTANRTLPPPQNQSLRIRFDYSYDAGYYDPDTWEYTPPFFEDQARRDLLELAADMLLSSVRDDLDAIVPSGDNHWAAIFPDPSTGQDVEVWDLSVEENELVIFVGGRDLDASDVGILEGGLGGPGGSRASGTSEFISTVETRGERGAHSVYRTDFGPWGGSMAFNASPAAQYHFGETLAGLDDDEMDFVTVAMHELAHVLGFGTSPSWEYYVDPVSGAFTGPATRAEFDFGGDVPLDETLGHWLSGTTDGGEATLMDPFVEGGMRTWPTPLDLAALRDVGWGDEPLSVSVPIPYTYANGAIAFDVGELEVGKSVTMTVVVTPTQAGTAIHSVIVNGAGTDPDPANNSAQATTTVNPCPPLVVNTTWDVDDRTSDGRVTSLREAIRLANLLPGKDTISFAIPSSGSNVPIGIRSALPTITDPVVIDGTTQPGYVDSPVVLITGYLYRSGPNGLHITGGDSTIRGLEIGLFHEFYSPGSITQDNAILLEDGDGNVIEGNVLGTYETSAGIVMIRSDGNRIGGTTTEKRNVVSGNYGWGILAYDSNNNIIQGNYIGTDASGQLPGRGNGTGIALALADHNQIGGTEPGAGNVISGNRNVGIEVSLNSLFTNASHNTIEGNLIGVAADGATPLGNGSHGIASWLGNHGNVIGGREPNAANTIAFNGGAGVLYGGSTANTPIVGNSIHSNVGLGIDRLPLGVNENPDLWIHPDPGFPDLTEAVSSPMSTKIRGVMRGLRSTRFQLDFYTNADADSSGHGEGQEWLGSAIATTDSFGLAPFYLPFPKSTPAGWFITATATHSMTSEFSNYVLVEHDADGDGVTDAEENGGPNSGDSNMDGTQDSIQAEVATFCSIGDQQQYVTLVTSTGESLYGIRAIENPSPANSPYAVPFSIGFVEGEIEGIAPAGPTMVTLRFPVGAVPDHFYQFGPTQGLPYDTWYDFAFDGTTGAEIHSNHVVLHYVDGGRGDHDLVANGRIIFRGGVSGPPGMHIVSVIPGQNDRAVPRDADVSLTYATDIDPATVSDQSLFVHANSSGHLVVPPNALVVDRATATLNPTGPFHPGDLVQVTATREIESIDNEPSPAAYVWQFRVAAGEGPGTFLNSNQVLAFGDPDEFLPRWNALAVGDVDQDGDVDALVGERNVELASSEWEWGVLLNDGQGHLSDSGHRLSFGNVALPWRVTLGDLDGDADLDAFFIASGSNLSASTVWLNDGQGRFTDSGQRLAIGERIGIALGDVDGDGDLDAVIVGRTGYAPQLWLNDGRGQFNNSGRYLGSGWPYYSFDVELGDVDADGDLDVLFPVAGWQGVPGRHGLLWLNDGRGYFVDSGQWDIWTFATGVTFGDLDGDADLDVFVSGYGLYSPGQLLQYEERVLLNDGQGRFADSGQRLGTGTAFSSLATLGDLDGDGDLDAMVNEPGSSKIWFNDGRGRFTRGEQEFPNANVVVPFVDIDGDGDLDAFLSGSDCHEVWLNEFLDETDYPPVAADDGYIVDQGASLDVSPAGVLANDTEPNSEALTAVLVTGPLHASSFELLDDGSFSYTPQPDYSGLDSFTYEARDPQGLAATAKVSLLVAPGPAAPVARDDFATTMQAVPVVVDVTANDSDRSGRVDPTTITFLTAPTLGRASIDLDTGLVTYEPQPGFFGIDRFTYQITGPTGLTAAATVTVEILGSHARPIAEDDAATTDEGTPVLIDVAANDMDPDGMLDPSSVRIRLHPAHGSATVELPGGMVRYVPDVGFFGEDLLTYEICDSHGACTSAAVALTVRPVPDAPLANDDHAEIRINAAITVVVLANDFDADGDLAANTVQVVTDPHNGVVWVDAPTGSVTYQPRQDFVGQDVFTYRVCDATELCDTATVTIEVRNDPPVAVDDEASTQEAVPVVIDLAANDFDPDGNLVPASVRIVIQPFGATVSVDPLTGAATYSPRSGFFGVDVFAYEISDTTGALGPPAVGLVHVIVAPVNDPPQSRDDTAIVLPDTAIDLDILSNDTDVDSWIDRATVRIEEGPVSGSAEVQDDGRVRYTPREGFTGTDQFRYTVHDDAGARSNVSVVTISVQALPPMLLVGRVFEDTDREGPGLAGPGIAGCLIYLLDGQGQLLATTHTQEDDPATSEDETGWYHFPDLSAGTYVVAEGRVAGWWQSHPPDAGIHLDDPPVSPGLYVVTLSAAHTLEVLDFGNFRSGEEGTASIAGYVYVDVDNDGICDPQEIGLPNVPITIAGPVTRVVLTDATGHYRADDLPPGVYTISETQPLIFQDGRDTCGTPVSGRQEDDRFVDVELLPGMAAEDYNFGEYGLKAQFISKQLYLASTPPASQYVAQLQVEAGQSLVLVEAPTAGTFSASAQSEGETPAIQLYDYQWRPVSLVSHHGTLRAAANAGDAYLIYIDAQQPASLSAVLGTAPLPDPVYVHTNPHRPLDVSGDGYVSPRDALILINALNASGTRRLSGVNLGPHYIDVNRDSYLSPFDALLVLNTLNRVHGEGEGEAAASVQDRALLVYLQELDDSEFELLEETEALRDLVDHRR